MVSQILVKTDLILRIFTIPVHFFDKYYLENLNISYICHLGKVTFYLFFSYGKNRPDTFKVSRFL